jgi:predicted O-methyltransferase YrrM
MTGAERVLEFGSGRSTLWFAHNAAQVVSIEHNPQWVERVRHTLRKRGLLERVEIRLASAEQVELAAGDLTGGSVDVVLIDGVRRAECLRAALSALKSGGLLLIDNINRYIPCESRGPGTLRAWPEEGSPWRPLAETLQHWEHSWTTDGVTDTWVGVAP